MNKNVASFFVPGPRSAAFIVTIYGDIVEPRGGVLWIGNLIDLCSAVGLNESLVRTSVSRLVNAGQLVGERSGRQSFYRLTPKAQAEYRQMAMRVYHFRNPPKDWMIIARSDVEMDDCLKTRNFAVMNRNLLFGPNTSDDYPDALVFEAKAIHGEQRLKKFVSTFWDIDKIASCYHCFIQKYRGFEHMALGNLSPLESLLARLAVVHDYRLSLANDPDLPRNSLPADWPADEAKKLFARLYLRLSDEAENFIHENFKTNDGQLARNTELTDLRSATLQKILAN